MYYLVAFLILIIVVLAAYRFKDCHELKNERRKIESEIFDLKAEEERLKDTISYTQNAISVTNEKYEETINKRNQDLIQYQKDIEEQERILRARLSVEEGEYSSKIEDLEKELFVIQNLIKSQSQNYQNLIASQKTLEKEEQEKRFYTVQISEEYQSDIDYLLNSVAPQVKHPDIISKLIWQEYVKPSLDETLKRVGIENEAGIYKITSLTNGKAYIGKSTNLKKRLQDHFKSAVGISSIADQEIHHQILKEGIWNWTIEKVCSCEKNELGDKEKFFIASFKTQEWGYNKTAGG